MDNQIFKILSKPAAALVVAAGIGLCAACTSLPPTAKTNTAAPAEIRILATEFKYEPAILEVSAGVPVTLILDNSGATTQHGLAVAEFGVRLEARAGDVAKKTVAFTSPGEYDFTCDLPGHTEAGMKGKLVVKE